MDHNTHDHSKHMSPQMPVPNVTAHQHDMSLSDNGAMVHSDMPSPHAGHSMDMSDHMMKMYFHCSPNATILFSGWKTTSWETMLGSCIAVFIMAALYEGLKVMREYLLHRTTRGRDYDAVPVVTNADGVHVRQPGENDIMRVRMLSLAHGLQTLLHLIQIVVSYFLMLIFMTYNVYLCVAVALGAATGYFFFSWKRAIVNDINDHCH